MVNLYAELCIFSRYFNMFQIQKKIKLVRKIFNSLFSWKFLKICEICLEIFVELLNELVMFDHFQIFLHRFISLSLKKSSLSVYLSRKKKVFCRKCRIEFPSGLCYETLAWGGRKWRSLSWSTHRL